MLLPLLQNLQSGGSDVSVALSGLALSSSQGTFGVALDKALTGQGITSAQGTLSQGVALALTGQALASAAGSLGVDTSVALSGLSLTSAAGTITPAALGVVALTGQSIGIAQGSLRVQNDGIPDVFSGGFVRAYRSELERRSRERKRRKELEEETERIEEETAREIALLLREQEAKDARRSELARLSDLVARSQGTVDEAALSPRALKAIKTAAQKQTAWALFQLEREMKRAQEEEDFVIQALYRALH